MLTVAEDVVINPRESQEGCRIPTLCSALHLFSFNERLCLQSFFLFFLHVTL